MKKFILASLFSCLVLLAACEQKASPDQGTGDSKIRLEVSLVPHEEIVKALGLGFRRTGLNIKVTTFDDYVIPNLTLDQGDLDANFFQHAPYLDDLIKERGVKLVNLGAVHLEPIGSYSDKYKSVDELGDGDEILIPNDTTNGGRALILLEKAGVIKLNDPSNLAVTEKDITEDPKNLRFTVLDAPSIPRSHKEVVGVVIDSNYTLGAGSDLIKNGLLTENEDSPYVNTIAVRQGEKGQKKFKKSMEVLHSEACRKLIEGTYKGVVAPAL